jgi:hypothetical protein
LVDSYDEFISAMKKHGLNNLEDISAKLEKKVLDGTSLKKKEIHEALHSFQKLVKPQKF